MGCNGICALCTNHRVVIKNEPILVESVTGAEVANELEHLSELQETGLVLANSGLEPVENLGEYKITKNIFGKSVVKKVKNGNS